MVMTNKDIEEFNKQLDEIRKDKGPNDLETQIEAQRQLNIVLKNKIIDSHKKIKELENIEDVHRKINGQLRKEVYDWKIKAAKADEYKTTIEQHRQIISDLSVANNNKK